MAADGSGSRIRRQLLPHAPVVDVGLRAVFGKTPLTEEVRRLAPPAAMDGFSAVVGTDGRFLPLAGLEFRRDPNEAAAELRPGLKFPDTRDYVMWVLGARREAYGARADRLADMAGAALVDVVLELISDWHPDLSALIRRSDAGTVRSLPLRTAVPIEHWETGPVTLVGDAIHCMVPAGSGAAVALRDAAELSQRLAVAHAGGTPLLQAVHDYEVAMLEYGFAAVLASQRVVDQFSGT
ncbi:MAG: hypothetical protein GEV03_27195 [Streptosporangiales bacterium]|nr:hypothetical protein [Streptosporangiales bacterium]